MRPAPPAAVPAPPISGHQDALDGLRAIAALAVLAFHVASASGAITLQGGSGWLFNGGQVGVPIFFTLSGLLLYRPWAAAVLDGRAAPRVGDYLLKRVLRIMPAYWALVVVFMVTSARGHLTDPLTWGSLLTLTQTYLPDPWWGGGLGPARIGQTWSLVVEAGWYALLPLTAPVLSWYARRVPTRDPGVRAKRLLRAIGVYGALSFVYVIFMFVPDRHTQMGLWPPHFFVWFAIGMAMAVVTVWARLDQRRPVAAMCRTVAESWGACWAAAAMLYVVAATPATGPYTLQTPDALWTSVLHLIVYGLVAVALVAPVAFAPPGHPVISAVLGNRVMRFLGRISYGVFLWQMIILLAWYDAADRLFHGNVATDLPLVAMATIAAATLSYYLVERPVMALLRRRRRPRADPDPARTVPDPVRPADRRTARSRRRAPARGRPS
ncbi:acyltransferase family protein [Actinomadura opuntiae]|uniref:acyltransferase family protein n=1 Tax=Actinomadura sp. OS1-43 TaxID=604315 RepID=UPI00255B1D14|nr:acyltransferase [Actinomadura sp. OS1-43]MDL4814566.1 acyltransferase [Actinomadura sp. OS1-43]